MSMFGRQFIRRLKSAELRTLKAYDRKPAPLKFYDILKAGRHGTNSVESVRKGMITSSANRRRGKVKITLAKVNLPDDTS